ncbi:MAG: peptide chain release factor N(5)-glutamine methyltransferase, partial [Candidatus Omnitrophica bacterium]|nr:peptide chain release factor N(5)-glutamine methyltransferase [Candidatus Omnitrophota bacterium]
RLLGAAQREIPYYGVRSFLKASLRFHIRPDTTVRAPSLSLRPIPPVAVRRLNSILKFLEEAQRRVSRIDAEILLAHLLGVSKAELYIYEDKIDSRLINTFNKYVKERARKRPLQYILGSAEFMGLEFTVTEDVLIPRPETELLVEEAVKAGDARDSARILDLGTGSGNIAIALTTFLTNCKIIASDVSDRALLVAAGNAKRNRADKTIDFILSNLFENLPEIKFDLIVSNPPYVASGQFDALEKEIGFEPRIALDGGHEGLDFHKKIIDAAPDYLKNRGTLILEIGFDQSPAIEGILKRRGFRDTRFIPDHNGIKRVAVSQWIN